MSSSPANNLGDGGKDAAADKPTGVGPDPGDDGSANPPAVPNPSQSTDPTPPQDPAGASGPPETSTKSEPAKPPTTLGKPAPDMGDKSTLPTPTDAQPSKLPTPTDPPAKLAAKTGAGTKSPRQGRSPAVNRKAAGNRGSDSDGVRAANIPGKTPPPTRRESKSPGRIPGSKLPVAQPPEKVNTDKDGNTNKDTKGGEPDKDPKAGTSGTANKTEDNSKDNKDPSKDTKDSKKDGDSSGKDGGKDKANEKKEDKENNEKKDKESGGDKKDKAEKGPDSGNGDDPATPKAPSHRLLVLSSKAEWSTIDNILRNMDKGNPEVNIFDAETGVTPLMIAIRENRLVIAERLLDLGANINDQAKDGRTALHYAAAYSRDDVAKLLVNRKADPLIQGGPKDQLPLHMASARPSGVATMVSMLLKASGREARIIPDKDGVIPLFLAAEAGNTAVCRELLHQLKEEQIKAVRLDNKETVLHIACRRKDHDMVKLFVESGANVDAQDDVGFTPLHVSAWEGDEILVKYLYQVKANPNIIDNMDRSPLHLAAERGHTSIVEVLVDKLKANVAARTKDGSTLMHIASLYGHPDTALAFLKKGVPMLMPNKSGAICLHAAAEKGHTSVIKALLQKGAPVDATTKDGYTALHIAVEHCKPLAVQTLLGHGAAVELKGGQAKETPLHIAARVMDGEKCAEMLIKSGANVNATKENGETALHIASRHGLQQMVLALLVEGADPQWQSKNGETPLHVAVRYCHWEVADELLRFLVKEKSKTDATILVNTQNGEGETAVHYAAELTKAVTHHEFEDTDMIKLLLEYDGDTNVPSKLTNETPIHYCARAGNADILLEIVKHLGPNKVQTAVNKQAKNGWSPLLVASENGHLEILKILLQYHARVDVFDEHGKAALHLSAENGHDAVADILLQHKAFVNAKSKLGLTPLHLAAQNGFNKLLKELIDKHKATIDALSLAKKTPLHLAAQNGQIEVCNTLLKMKADANATDDHGQTPLHLAAENDHSDVVKLFLKHRPELVSMANTVWAGGTLDHCMVARTSYTLISVVSAYLMSHSRGQGISLNNGMTCAHIAASKGSVAVVKELMRFNKSVVTTARNKTNDSSTLHLAAAGGHADVVRALLEAGASATDENADGMTAIHLAARHGHGQVLEALKGHMSWKVTSTKTGLTALHVAAQYGQMEFVREMLSRVPATVRSEPPLNTDGPHRDTPAEHGLTPLHLAAQSGHEGLVRMLLNSSGVQADAATVVQGVIPLHQAAQHGHTAVVSLLLSKSTAQISVKDKRGRTGLHLAASNGHLDMVSLLLGQGADINCYDKNGGTPLHYAAKAGHLAVVKLLVESGASTTYETKDGKVPICYAATANHADVLSYLLNKQHDTYQLMNDRKFVFDIMSLGKMNDNMSIQEFVLVSPAPADTAAKMSRAFRNLATKEKERAKDLLLAGDFCEAMAVELNAIAASICGAALLLKSHDEKGSPFLDVLIECEQKDVVAHPSVQRYLTEVWTGHLSHWPGWKLMLLFVLLIFIPPIWLAFSVPNKHIHFNKVPVIKFMSYLVSHVYLIVLYTLTIVFPLYPLWESGNLLPHWYEWLLLAWFSGLLVSQLTNPEDRAGLGWIKVLVIIFSAVGVLVHVLAVAYDGDERLYVLYARNQFFGLSLLLCFVQLLDFLSFHHLFGPWAIIIRDLMKDLLRFLVILILFMLGFTLQLAAIYRPVTAPVPLQSDLGDGTGDGGAYEETAWTTFELLFFALFGLVDPENLPAINRSPVWSIYLAKAVFGIYLIVSIIVLINLLIAMMSDTYQRIQAQSDTEWKFGRAKLFRNMNKTSATPSPLNLLTKLVIYIKILIKHKSKACTMDAQKYVDEEEELDIQVDNGDGGGYMRNVARRGTQVAPEEDFVQQNAWSGDGPRVIEEVVDWKKVADRYLALRGLGGGSDDEGGDADEAAHKPSDEAVIT